MTPGPSPSELVSGGIIALLAGTAATFLDIYSTLSKSLPRVPRDIMFHRGVLALSAFCGPIALATFLLTDGRRDDILDTVITLRATDERIRGLTVGLTVLVIIRSKIFNLSDAAIGGEYVYTLLRALAVQSVNDARTRQRLVYLKRSQDAAFINPDFFRDVEALIRECMRTASSETGQRALAELEGAKKDRPTIPPCGTDPGWVNYYYTMAGICFDYCGPRVMGALAGFAAR